MVEEKEEHTWMRWRCWRSKYGCLWGNSWVVGGDAMKRNGVRIKPLIFVKVTYLVDIVALEWTGPHYYGLYTSKEHDKIILLDIFES